LKALSHIWFFVFFSLIGDFGAIMCKALEHTSENPR
jgi:hypothetical protein